MTHDDDAELWEAFRTTRFHATTPMGEIIICIDAGNEALDRLLHAHKERFWCFVTAWNPGGKELPRHENLQRNEDLRTELTDARAIYFPGKGIGQNSTWTPEESFLVLGLAREEAIALGRKWGQLAVVAAAEGGLPKLLDCRPSEGTRRLNLVL